MNVHLPIPLFFILQLFISIAWSQGATPSVSLVPPSTFPSTTSTSTSNSTTTSLSATGTANSTSLSVNATTTSTAQYPSLSGVSSCVSDCLAEGSARLNCTSVVDVNCFCVNHDYPAEIVDCVLASCSNEVQTIESLGQQFCNIASVHPTLSFPSVPATTTTSPSTTSTTPSSTVTTPPTSTSTSSAVAFSLTSMKGSTLVTGLGILLALGMVFGV